VADGATNTISTRSFLAAAPGCLRSTPGRKLGVPAIDTADAAAAFGLSTAAASQTLTRLARAGLIRSVRHGTWWLEDALDPLRLPEYLTAPFPAYVSLQTALNRRGLIEQIPEVVYAVSLTRTQRVRTKVGTFSIHHVAPEVFGGYEETEHGAKLATAEKALFDFAYLSSGRSRLWWVRLEWMEVGWRRFARAALAPEGVATAVGCNTNA
jgi:hypothetical protein